MKESLLKKRKKKGFTLIELIVVIAIISIIALIAIPKVMGYQDSAKKKADIANAKTIANAVSILITENDTDIVALKGGDAVELSTQSKITAKLQSVPKVQLDPSANFYIQIDGNSNVSVYSAKSKTVDSKNILFPTQGSNYNP